MFDLRFLSTLLFSGPEHFHLEQAVKSPSKRIPYLVLNNVFIPTDWNELFTTKCFACGFPIEAGDRWVEALNNNYHSPCFNCTVSRHIS